MLVRVEDHRFSAMRAKLASKLGADQINESALPSYLHRNPLIPWIVWRRLARALELAGPTCRAGAVLDFGCGTGALLPSLCHCANRVYATDLQLDLAAQLVADEKLPVDLLEADRFAAVIAPASLSLITAIEVLEHVDNPRTLVRLFHRLLEPAGRLVVSVPTENWFYRCCRRIAGFSGDYHHDAAEGVQGAVEQSGFTVLERSYLPFDYGPALFVVTSYGKEGATQ